MGAKISKRYSSLKFLLNRFKIFLNFLLSGPHKVLFVDFWNFEFLLISSFGLTSLNLMVLWGLGWALTPAFWILRLITFEVGNVNFHSGSVQILRDCRGFGFGGIPPSQLYILHTRCYCFYIDGNSRWHQRTLGEILSFRPDSMGLLQKTEVSALSSHNSRLLYGSLGLRHDNSCL